MDPFGYTMERAEARVPYDTYNGPFLSNNDDAYPISKCKVTLKNKELWKKFHDLETEMIITKSGRRMFPSIQVQVSELDPQAHYSIFLEMAPAARCRFKYSSAGGWAPAGSEEAQSPHRIHLHPESPAKGEYWMSQPISFGRVKLTNTPAPPSGQVVLSSMHKYQPRIIIVKTSDPRTIGWSPSTCAVFPETQFIAVTAYQNEKITQLKIDNNPFAKGFRENGQAKCKRKRINVDEQDEEIIDVTDDSNRGDKDVNNNIVKKSRACKESFSSTDGSTGEMYSPRSRTSSEGDRISVCSSPLSVQGCPTVRCVKTERLVEHSEHFTSPNPIDSPHNNLELVSPPTKLQQLTPYPYPPNAHSYTPPTSYYPFLPAPVPSVSAYGGVFYPQYPGYYGSSMWAMSPQYLYPPRVENVKEIKKPTKLTDFSIKAIMGC